jgi:hypothetical protein
MSFACPTAAHACFTEISVGRSFKEIASFPTAIAPELTRHTSIPLFLISQSTRTNFSILEKLILPVFSWVKDEEPILIGEAKMNMMYGLSDPPLINISVVKLPARKVFNAYLKNEKFDLSKEIGFL